VRERERERESCLEEGAGADAGGELLKEVLMKAEGGEGSARRDAMRQRRQLVVVQHQFAQVVAVADALCSHPSAYVSIRQQTSVEHQFAQVVAVADALCNEYIVYI
jgi:hypothetical protein